MTPGWPQSRLGLKRSTSRKILCVYIAAMAYCLGLHLSVVNALVSHQVKPDVMRVGKIRLSSASTLDDLDVTCQEGIPTPAKLLIHWK